MVGGATVGTLYSLMHLKSSFQMQCFPTTFKAFILLLETFSCQRTASYIEHTVITAMLNIITRSNIRAKKDSIENDLLTT